MPKFIKNQIHLILIVHATVFIHVNMMNQISNDIQKQKKYLDMILNEC